MGDNLFALWTPEPKTNNVAKNQKGKQNHRVRLRKRN